MCLCLESLIPNEKRSEAIRSSTHYVIYKVCLCLEFLIPNEKRSEAIRSSTGTKQGYADCAIKKQGKGTTEEKKQENKKQVGCKPGIFSMFVLLHKNK